MNGESQIISEYYQKSLNIKVEIEKTLAEVSKGVHNSNLDKIREKIYEKYEILGDVINSIESLINDNKSDPNKLWKK
jgi:hypothetical protein